MITTIKSMIRRYGVLILFLIGTVCFMASSDECCAQFCGGGYKPPPESDPPSPPKSAEESPGEEYGTGMPTPAQPARAGAAPGVTPLGARTGAGAGKGGLTKKAKAPTAPPITWDVWWARNRYQFFHIKDLFENIAGRYPVTPRVEEARAPEDLLSGLRSQCLTTIRTYLDHKHASLRRIAVLALGRMKDPDSVDRMMDLLQENNKSIRNTAVIALGIHGSPEARHTLFHIALGTETACRMLGESTIHPDLRVYAEIILAITNAAGAKPILQSIAVDESSPRVVRAMALEGLGLAGGEDSAAFLIEFCRDPEAEPYLLSYALTALCKTGEPIGEATLRKNLFSKHMPARQAAAVGLGRIGTRHDEALVKDLYRCYRHTNDQALSGYALVSMGLVGGPEAVQRLYTVAKKGKSSEQPWACLGLGFALRDAPGETPMQHLITQATSRGNRSIRGAATIALGIARCHKAVPLLVNILKKGDDPLLRGYSAQALGMINDPKTLGPLRRAMKEDPLPQVLVQVVLALGLMGDLESVPDLVDCMVNSPSYTIKVMVSRSLGYMGDPLILETFLKKLHENSMDVHTSTQSICLLSRLLSSQTKRYMDRLAAYSNFSCEFPVVEALLNSGI